MLKLRHLNMDKAVNRFLQNVDSLIRLPLITDEDMLAIWGEEVTTSLADLGRFNQHSKICVSCEKSCCPVVHCELYFLGFSQCPIFPFRPAICRMHFCRKFAVNDISFVNEFGDIYLNSLYEAKLQGIAQVDLFDSPPLGRYAPELVSRLVPLIAAFKEGKIDEMGVLSLINSEAQVFFTPPNALQRISR